MGLTAQTSQVHEQKKMNDQLAAILAELKTLNQWMAHVSRQLDSARQPT